MYAHVVYLSDICMATEDKIEQLFWNQPMVKESSYHWLVMPKPKPSEWCLWQQAMQTSLSLIHQLKLPLHLGNWISSHNNGPKWFYHEDKTALYKNQTKSGQDTA